MATYVREEVVFHQEIHIVERAGRAPAVPAEPTETLPSLAKVGGFAAVGVLIGLIIATLHTGPSAGWVYGVETMFLVTGLAIICTLAAFNTTLPAPRPS